MTFDLTRLVDSASSASPALREAVRSAADDAPTAAELAKLTARMAPQLGPAPAVASTAASGGAAAAKVATIVVVAGVLAVGGWLLSRSDAPASTPPAFEPPTPVIVAPAPSPVVEEAPALAPPQSKAKAPSRRAHGATPAARPPSEPAAPTEDEVTLIAQAKRALRGGDARTALGFTESHDLSFPSGALVEEREAIAIEALGVLGNANEARARFEHFRARFPRSGYRRRLERLLGEP